MCKALLLTQPVDNGVLGYFHILATVNRAAMNVSIQQIPIYIPALTSGGGSTYPEVELLNHTVLLFLILMNCYAMFHSSCIIIHCYPHAQGFQFLHIRTNTCCYFI